MSYSAIITVITHFCYYISVGFVGHVGSRSTPVVDIDGPESGDRPTGASNGGATGGAARGAVGGAATGDAAGDAPANGLDQTHEKSFDSEMADEGLDMSHISQTKEASMFVGPCLNYSEEELILGEHCAYLPHMATLHFRLC